MKTVGEQQQVRVGLLPHPIFINCAFESFRVRMCLDLQMRNKLYLGKGFYFTRSIDLFSISYRARLLFN